MKAYLKSGKKILNSAQTLVDIIESKQDPRIKNNRGIYFIDIDGNEFFESYEALYNNARLLLTGLKESGVKKGDYVIFQLTEEIHFVRLFWGCILGGIIPIPLSVANSTSPNSEAYNKLTKVSEQLNFPLVIAETSILETVKKGYEQNNIKCLSYGQIEGLADRMAETIKPGLDDIAYFQYSSGSTGNPKGVMLTHKNLFSNLFQITQRAKIDESDTLSGWMPLTHDMGLVGYHLVPIYLGSNHLIYNPETFIKRPKLYLEKVGKFQVSILASPNFALLWMIDKISDNELSGLNLTSARLFFDGAEPISMDVIRKFNKKFAASGLKPDTVYQVYGMAEACVAVCMPEPGIKSGSVLIDRHKNSISENVSYLKADDPNAVEFAIVGSPLDEMEIKIIDDDGNLLDEDYVGNIVIKGPNIFNGYFLQKEARFTDDGFFHTGDIGFVCNKKLIITGRKKDILFVHGQNYYAHDIERIIDAKLEKISARSIVGAHFNNQKGSDEIIIFIRYRKNIDEFIKVCSEVQDALIDSMGFQADYILPVKLIPKTTSGKPQRFKLVEQFTNGEFNTVIEKIEQKLRPGETPVQGNVKPVDDDFSRRLLAISNKVFDNLNIDPSENIAKYRADSLRLIHFLDEIYKEFGVNVPISSMLKYRTLKELCIYIREQSGKQKKPVSNKPVQKTNDETHKQFEPFDLTEVQLAYLMGRQNDFELGGISTHAYYELETSLDIGRFNDALNKVIKRQPMLRAIFYASGKQQVLEQVPAYEIKVDDISALDKKGQQEKIESERERMSHYVFELDKWPLFEFRALRISNTKHYLFIGLDLLIADGTSIFILFNEIIGYYKQPDLKLPEITYSFSGYMADYMLMKKGSAYHAAQEYWNKKLTGFPPAPQIPLIKSPETVVKPRFERVQKKYPGSFFSSLKEVALRKEVTPSALFCTAFADVLSKWANQPELAINITLFNRLPFHQDVGLLIGDFTSILLLGVDCAASDNFWQRASYIQNTLFESLENRQYSGIDFLRDIIQSRGLSGKAAMPVVFTSMLTGGSEPALGNIWEELGEFKFGISQTPQVFLDFQLMEINGQLSICWDYVSDILDKQLIDSMFHEYLSVLESLPKQEVHHVRLPEQDIQLFSGYNATDEKIQTGLLHGLIDMQVEKTPDNIAVKYGTATLTYSELGLKSNQIARSLRQSGYQRGDFIGVIGERQIETIVNLVGILKAGCAYIPIDPDYPQARKDFILQHANCKTLLYPGYYEVNNLEKLDGSTPGYNNGPDDIAYVIFTSGSTGNPKGVVITHRAVSNTIIDINQRFEVCEDDKIIGLSSMCFDLSVYDIFGSLTSGAQLVLIPALLDVNYIKKTIREEGITLWNSVPAIMDMLLENMEDPATEIDYWQINQEQDSEFGFYDSVRLIMLSGDWIPLSLPGKIKETFPFSETVSLGGATEASIWSIYYPINEIDPEWKSIPYGFPLANQKMYVLDYKLEQCPVGVTGEIFIGGIGVALGYLNDEGRTKESFICHKEFGHIYKTGDYGVFHRKGYIEFLGRKDFQVKIRGHRIELGEIENCLLKIAGIKSALVTDKTDEYGKKYLCSYIVQENDLDIPFIKESLENHLPAYMVPQAYVRINEIPLSPNGKVDKKRLPEPGPVDNINKQHELPSNEVEIQLHSIWCSVLKDENIGVNDNFFDLGGDSLKVAMMISKIQKDFSVELPLKEIFLKPTIREVAKFIKGSSKKQYIDLQPVKKQDYYEVSPAQRRMYLLNQIDKNSLTYNTPVAIKIEGEIDEGRLKETINKLADRHDAFRTSFIIKDKSIVQQISTNTDIRVEIIDIQTQQGNREILVDNIIKGFVRPFDLEKAPLFRVGLIKDNASSYYLMFDSHHIITDGISKEIITNDFTMLYAGEELPTLKYQYKDYAAWQNSLLQGEDFVRQEKFWLEQLQGEIPALNLPLDFSRPQIQSFEGKTYVYKLDSSIKDPLQKIKAETDSTLYMLLLSAFNILLAKYSGQEDIIVGSPVAGRNHPDMASVVGVFVNTLSLRNFPEGDKTIDKFLVEVKDNIIKALDNQDYPFEDIVEKIKLNRDVSRNPVFDVFFALQNMEVSSAELENLKLASYNYENKISKFDLSVYAYELKDHIKLEFEYSTKLFKEETIEKLAKSYEKIVRQLIGNRELHIREIEYIIESDNKKISAFNNTDTKYPVEKTIVQLFEEQADKSPDDTAVVFGDKSLTYRELNCRSNQLAGLLRKKGVKPGEIVGLYINRSIEMIVGILGTLKSGGAYLPIDPDYPGERVEFVLDDSGAKIVLSAKNLIDKPAIQKEFIDISLESIYKGSGQNLQRVNTSTDLAYLIYTSGTTGKPKGVMIEHKALHNFIIGVCGKIEFAERSKILAVTTISFDIFWLETILPLCKGLEVIIANEAEISDPMLLSRLVHDKNIDMLQFTPSRMKMLLAEGNMGNLENVSTLMVGGEALQQKLLKDISGYNWKIYNMYGPTETTIWSSISDLTGKTEVNIGKPIANTRIFILDRFGKICPVGVVGEICIAGDGLSRGYFNREGLTNEKFVGNQYEPGNKVYKTGDLGRWKSDGNIECFGRTDHQIKLRGYRIELEEIESQVLNIPGMNETALVSKPDSNGDNYLWCYFTGDREFKAKELRDILLSKLPDYMVPSFFVQLEKLPLTPNGKIDRKSLPEVDISEHPVEIEPARNETDEKIIKIWQEVLNRKNIGINNNFFEIGGNSLGVVKVARLLSESFKKEIEVVTLFQYPNIKALSDYITSTLTIQDKNKKTKEISSKKPVSGKRTEDIAIIGMAGRFPKADNTGEFWQNLVGAKESISFYSTEELLAEGIDSEALKNPNYVKAASLINNLEYFDAEFFGYTRGDAEKLDPQIRVFAECTWEALEDSGYIPDKYEGKIGLFAGASTNFHWQYLTFNQSSRSVSELFNTMQLNDKQFLPTHISYKLGLKGPAVFVNTACSTSLVAIHLACKSILNGECNIAIAGAVSGTQAQKSGYFYEDGMILSRDGHCRAFDANANGTVFGNGAGAVVLKPLSDALSDNDNIYAVIKGSAVNNDGNGKVGYTAPSIGGQKEVIENALSAANTSPEEICFVETHGTGTPLGDPIEIEALRQAYNTDKKGYCAVGSVKTNIGHLDVAAGIAGLIKSVLSIKNRQLPASLNMQTPNPSINFKESPFFVNTGLLPITNNGKPIKAGVSSFGIGGTNAHIIIEGAPETKQIAGPAGSLVFIFSGRSIKALEEQRERVMGYLKKNDNINPVDVAYTLSVGRKGFKYRKAIVSNSGSLMGHSQENLKYVSGQVTSLTKPVAFMFPGQGSQYAGMGRGLYDNEKVFRETIDYCFNILDSNNNGFLKNLLFDTDASDSKIDETEFAQPLIFAFEYSLAKLLMHWGIEPEIMIGHSIGEYVAATIAGVIEIDDALRLVKARGKFMQEMPRGAMLSVMINSEKLNGIVGSNVSVAAINSTNMCVLSGKFEDIGAIEEKLIDKDIPCIRLKTSHAYHSQLMEGAAAKFCDYLQQIKFNKPNRIFISNLTGRPITDDQATDPAYWADHLLSTVHFEKGVANILQNKNTTFIEVGSGRALSTMIREHAQYTNDRLIVNLIRHPKENCDDKFFLAEKVARLWTSGIDINWEKYFEGANAGRISLPTYPFERERFWMYADRYGLRNPLTPVAQRLEFNNILHKSDSDSTMMSGSAEDVLDTVKLNKSLCPAENKLIEIVEDIFGARDIKAEDNFFDLGGDSLKAVILSTRIQKELNAAIPYKTIFETPVIKDLATYIKSAHSLKYNEIKPVGHQTRYELSPVQQRQYILNKMAEGSTNYNVPDAVEITGKLDPEKIKDIVNALVLRHESFRTSFNMIDGDIVQQIHEGAGVAIEHYDISKETGDKNAVINERIKEFIRPFDLSSPPLLRVGLIKVQEDKNVLIIDTHHIVSDGASMAIIIREFLKLYNNEELPPLKIQYKDFVAWQKSEEVQNEYKRQEGYWTGIFKDNVPVSNLPLDFPRLPVQSLEGARINFELNSTIKANLDKINKDTGTTTYMALLASFNILISKYSGQEDLIIGIPVAARTHVDLENVVGMFVNTLALRNNPGKEKTFNGFLGEVKANTLKAFDNQDYPFDSLVEKINIKRERGRNPLFDVMFVQQDRDQFIGNHHQLEIKPCKVERNTSMFDLVLYSYIEKNNINLTFEYCTKLFRKETINQMANDFIQIVKIVSEKPNIALKDIHLKTSLKMLSKANIEVDFNF